MRVSLLYEHQLPRPWTAEAEARLFADALEEIELADRLGIDRVWVTERHFHEEQSHSAAPAVFLAAASQRTSRIRLGIAGLALLPGDRHPARVAESVATLDLLSGGRVDVAVGEPASGTQLGGLGAHRSTARREWSEALGVVVRMMSEEPFSGHDGTFLSMPARNVVPKPAQAPHPPLWLACVRREEIRDAAERGLGALCTTPLDPGEAREWAEEYRAVLASEHCVATGLSVTPRVAVTVPFHVHEDEEEALARGLDGVHFAGYARAHYDVFGDHRPGRTDLWEEFLERREDVGFSRASVEGAERGAPLDVRVRGSVRGAIGTPAQVRDLLRRYEDAGVDEVVLAVRGGRTRHDDALESLELFGREVLPDLAARAEAAEASRTAALHGSVEAALVRRVRPPVADPAYAIGPMDDAASAGSGRRAEAAAPPPAPSTELVAQEGTGRRARPLAARSLGRSAEAAQRLVASRGEDVLRAIVGRSDDRRVERTIGSDRGLRVLFAAMARRFDPSGAQGFTGDLRYELRGADGRVRTWTVSCRLDGARAVPGPREEPAVTISTGLADFVRIAAGELDPGAALLTGRLDVEGDFAVASRLAAMFRAPSPMG